MFRTYERNSDGSVDLILTDPPYGITACKWDSVIPFDLMWEQLKRIIKPSGATALFGSEPFIIELYNVAVGSGGIGVSVGGATVGGDTVDDVALAFGSGVAVPPVDGVALALACPRHARP